MLRGRYSSVALMMSMVLVLAGCAGARTSAVSDKLHVVTTTALLADIAANIGGDRIEVSSIVPAKADPHTYEPSLRNVREVVYADVAFSNYLMLEQHSVIKTLDANLPKGALNLALAEEATKYGAEVIPLVENANLDVAWLGMRIRGQGTELGADRSSEVRMRITDVHGPGQLVAYIAGTFGAPQMVTGEDGIALPTDAHTHMSWAFSEAGVYTFTVTADLQTHPERPAQRIDARQITVVVGPDPHADPAYAGKTIIERGHVDITADLDQRAMTMVADEKPGAASATKKVDIASTVVWVPSRALTAAPGTPDYRFLGKAGTMVYQLPQAVLGAHVHGEIDPHLWLNVRNVKAYSLAMEAAFAQKDPAHAAYYHERTASYLATLDALDAEVAAKLASIPPAHRSIITTHDAYGYLAAAYDLRIAGFVTSNPGTEPSLAQRRKLAETIRNQHVPAVFLEPTVLQRSSVLASVAHDAGVKVCPIYSDSFDAQVTTYVDLMRFNAQSLSTCLS